MANKFLKTTYEIWHSRGKNRLKGQNCVITYNITKFYVPVISGFKSKSVKPGSSKNLQAAHTYPLVELIPTGRIVESIMIVDAFNDDPSLYST